jgi:carbonic anhydrase
VVEEPAHEEVHWTYTGETGPQAWGSLGAENLACQTGTSQSPVDILEETVRSELSGATGTLNINYAHTEPLTVRNTGHSIQVDTAGENSITLDGKTYELIQFHFHTPSEHTVNRQPFPMEVHFVHQGSDGELAVIGVLMQAGAANAALTPFWQYTPAEEGVLAMGSRINLNNLLPADGRYYSYSGSLTTPPCTEDVNWIVMKTPVEVSQEQIDYHYALFGDTARPVQSLNGRLIDEF